jgi:hypothetical protein
MVRNVRGLRCVPRVVAACCCFVAVHCFCQPRTTMKLKKTYSGKLPVLLALSPMIFLWADTLQTDEDNLSRYACLPRSFKLNAGVFYATNQSLIRCFLLWPDKHAVPAL